MSTANRQSRNRISTIRYEKTYRLINLVYFLSAAEFLFACVNIAVHIVDSVEFTDKLQEKMTDHFNWKTTKSYTTGFLATYFVLNVVSLITSIVLAIGVRNNHLRKCHLYLFFSFILAITSFTSLILRSVWYTRVQLHCSPYDLVAYVIFLLGRISGMWIVKRFVMEVVVREKQRKMQDSFRQIRAATTTTTQLRTLPTVSPGSTKDQDGRNAIDQVIQSLEIDLDGQIPMEQLSINYNNVLKEHEAYTVLKGLLQKPPGKFTEVAIKAFLPRPQLTAVQNMLLEAKLLMFVKHENILRLLGVCMDNIQKGKIILILEYCLKGNLKDFLKDNYPNFVDQLEDDHFEPSITENIYENAALAKMEKFFSTDLVHWAQQVAKGMAFLENKKIIHCFLAAKNVMLCSRNEVKIANFTLASRVHFSEKAQTKTNAVEGPFPWRWMAVECMENLRADEVCFTQKSDIWSYGVFLWELFTLGAAPYEGMSASDFFPKLQEGYRMEMPCYATTEIYDLILKCWTHVPSGRPCFSELNESLQRILVEIKAKVVNNSTNISSDEMKMTTRV